MGLILAAGASLSSVLGDQWLEYFYCSEMPTDVLVRKGQHHTGKSGLLNRGGSENVITDGSTIVVNEGQCMIIVEQGAIVDICAEPGAYKYDTSSEPSIFSGNLGQGIKESFKKFAARVSYGGVTAKDEINTALPARSLSVSSIKTSAWTWIYPSGASANIPTR